MIFIFNFGFVDLYDVIYDLRFYKLMLLPATPLVQAAVLGGGCDHVAGKGRARFGRPHL